MQSKKKNLALPLSKPKVGPRGKKGLWRVFRPILDEEKCIKCQRCFMYCPEQAIETEGKNSVPSINYDWCTGCGVCANECPVDAIEMVKEAREKGEEE